MATYEEMFGADGEDDVGARMTGGFRFPSKSPVERAAALIASANRPATIVVSTESMLDVLGPQTPAARARHVAPRPFEKGSYQDRVVEQTANELRAIRISGKTCVPYDPDHPEPFWEACAETAKAALEAEASIIDADEAAIASAIFKTAGFYSGGIHLLTQRAQVEAQMFVMEAAKRVKFLFAKQQELRDAG